MTTLRLIDGTDNGKPDDRPRLTDRQRVDRAYWPIAEVVLEEAATLPHGDADRWMIEQTASKILERPGVATLARGGGR